MPTVPTCLDTVAKNEWRSISNGLHIMGVLKQVDKAILAAYCQAYSQWYRAQKALNAMQDASYKDKQTGEIKKNPYGDMLTSTKNGNIIQNPLIGIRNTAARDMIKYAEILGITPSARSRLNTNGSGKKSKTENGIIERPKTQ